MLCALRAAGSLERQADTVIEQDAVPLMAACATSLFTYELGEEIHAMRFDLSGCGAGLDESTGGLLELGALGRGARL